MCAWIAPERDDFRLTTRARRKRRGPASDRPVRTQATRTRSRTGVEAPATPAGLGVSGQARRYLGLELSGAKNTKTALAAIQFFPREKKIFLVDLFERVSAQDGQSADQALLELIQELSPGSARLSVNVPLQLPPCLQCSAQSCSPKGHCRSAAVKWMHQLVKRVEKRPNPALRLREFTAYTQRPVELWLRYEVLPQLDPSIWFEIDETLGGNKAPLTARMHYLRRHLRGMTLTEAWPKLTIAMLQRELGLSRRTIQSYRQLEAGVHARQEILEALAREHHVFIYDRDLKKLSANLAAFDAFICAYTGVLVDLGRCVPPPKGFPFESGWVDYPAPKGRVK